MVFPESFVGPTFGYFRQNHQELFIVFPFVGCSWVSASIRAQLLGCVTGFVLTRSNAEFHC